MEPTRRDIDRTPNRFDYENVPPEQRRCNPWYQGMSKATFEVYVDRAGDWRWRLVHDNGNIIADSGEGYASQQKCIQGLKSVKRNAPDAPVTRAETPTGSTET